MAKTLEKQIITLILGAGASAPYSFPVGSVLRNRIIESFLPEGRAKTDLHLFVEKSFPEKNEEFFIQFAKTLNLSADPSIDSFLSTYAEEYGDLCKACISYLLMRCELDHKVFPLPSDTRTTNLDWIASFVGKFFTNTDKFKAAKRLNIVTYNYDRLFEHVLYHRLKAKLKLEDKEVKQLMGYINIHHVYGKLGNLSWEDEKIPKIPWWNNDKDLEKLYERALEASKHIRVISDQRQTDARIPDLMLPSVLRSDKIIFLGFAYDELNLERLVVDWRAVQGKVYGTTHRVPPAVLTNISTALGINFKNTASDNKQLIDSYLVEPL